MMLNDYFAVVSDDDTNFCTEEEMQVVLDRFNALCNTDYMVDFEITDTVSPGPGNLWGDALIWDDTDIWTD